jgi:diguanylate cyclase (GGDEF)-like protein
VAPLRDGDRGGDVVAAVTVDLPPFASSDTQLLRGDGKQTLAAMLQTAAVRLSRAEIDAITDSLTGLYNRRYLNERLSEEIDRAGEQGSPLSLLFGDLDHFKQFNDALGHSAGDRALRNVAQVFEQSLRRVDLAARYGGEEFVAVLVDTDADGAYQVAERIRRAIHREAHESGLRPLSMSIGTATFPSDGQTKEELLDKADWAMYLAKRRGRNRVQTFRPSDATAAERASLAQRHVAGGSF